jgi:hypothetical protein
VIEELCDDNIFIPKQGEFHSETKQIKKLGRVASKRWELERAFYAADGLLLSGVFHVDDVGADADEGEGD